MINFDDIVFDIARTDVLLAPIFSCFADDELRDMLGGYENFRLHLTNQNISNRSVILACAHFVKLHQELQRNMSASAARQVARGVAVQPIDRQVVISRYGERHWNLTTFGIEYQQLSLAGNTFSSMISGI